MSNVISRLLVFFIGIPIVMGIIYLPYFNHVAFHIMLLLITAGAASELHHMLSLKHKVHSKKLVVTLSTLISLVAALHSVLPRKYNPFQIMGSEVITYFYIITLLIILAKEAITAQTFEDSNTKIATSVFTITYTGFLITFIQRMIAWRLNGKTIIVPMFITFVLMVFMCDSIAWFMGVLFGKNNKGFVKASPNKSLMGFFGGFIGAIAAGIGAYYFWSEIFKGPVYKIIIISVCMAFSSIIGDLAESVFKRSSGVKDSGKVIPGRGGVLDSVDSILMSAPIFYLLVSILYGPF